MIERSHDNKLLPCTSKDFRSLEPSYMIFNTGYIVSRDIIWYYETNGAVCFGSRLAGIGFVASLHKMQRYMLYLMLRMYSINVPVIKSIKLAHRSVNVGYDDNPYLIADTDYDSTLGLLVDM